MFITLRFLALFSFALMGLGLSACETMEGAGRDIQGAGQSVEEAAE